MSDFDWSSYLKNCLNMTEYCCLASIGDVNPWANPVYFSYDDQLCLYFISQPHSAHMENLRKKSAVSIAIYSTAQTVHGDICGLQLSATAQIIDHLAIAENSYDRYYGRIYPKTRKHPNKSPSDFLSETAEWQFVKVLPKEVWCFDTRFFGEERVKVPEGIKISGV